MTDDRHPPSEYRWARQVSAVLLIAVVVLVVVLDVIVEGYEVSPPVLVPLLLTAAVLRESGRGVHVPTLDLLLGDHVDHAGDGVSAIGRRCAVTQHFDPLDDRVGNRVEVDEVALAIIRQRIGSQAQAVSDGQCRLYGQAAKRRCGSAR